MPKNLVIVESPAKAQTIEGYLGNDYVVKSSFGHIRDLPKKNMSIDIENGFKPTYEIPADKKKTIAELKKAAKDTGTVWLASDEDREGEAIAWHLCSALGLKPTETKRIVFHEITKSAIENAIKNPRVINQQLVDAQQARRVLDRLVGYELSPLLWKKVRPGLSAGRVQSVAVRLIVEREREIRDFKSTSSFKISASFLAKTEELPAELPIKLKTKEYAKSFLKDCKSASFSIAEIKKKPGIKTPSTPFTTSSLQQEAASRLGFSVKQTMTVAQRLYESGKITYMRTDSTVLSDQALKQAGSYISKEFGANYHKQRQYKTKQRNAQEAHEAIRPTNFSKKSAGEDAGQQKLYELIWRRTVSSQMIEAKVDKTEIGVAISTREEQFLAKGEVLIFDGFLKVYGGGKADVILPDLKVGDKLDLSQMVARESFERPPARYSEASLVRKLEELGIGRPSTFAPTISTIQARGYIEKGDSEGTERKLQQFVLEKDMIRDEPQTEMAGADKNKLLPTSLAEVITDFLVKHFSSVVDYAFTAKVEQNFDDIADGSEKWQDMLTRFYKDFHPLIDKAQDVSREETSQTRHLGKDPKTKQPIMARFGKYGPMLQRGETESETKPGFAPLPKGVRLEEVTLEQALEMFQLPRNVGKTADGQEITANIGRFGPYVKVGSLFVSIKDHDPFTISEQAANTLYEARVDQEAKKNIKEFKSGIKVLNGPYGPYVTDGKKNARIAKSVKPEKLTEVEAKEILDNAPDKKARFTKKFFNKGKKTKK